LSDRRLRPLAAELKERFNDDRRILVPTMARNTDVLTRAIEVVLSLQQKPVPPSQRQAKP
jgi:hypothetical protein